LIAPSESNDSDVIGNHGDFDFWLTKCDSIGQIIWSHCYGATGIDVPYAADVTIDGGIIMTGETSSDTSNMVSGNNGSFDIWVMKTDSNGSFEWGKCLGGPNEEHGYAVIQAPDGSIYVAGTTLST